MLKWCRSLTPEVGFLIILTLFSDAVRNVSLSRSHQPHCLGEDGRAEGTHPPRSFTLIYSRLIFNCATPDWIN